MGSTTRLFVLAGVLVASVFALDVWLLLDGRLERHELALVLGAELAVLLAALALGWAWMQLRLVRPLRRLRDDLRLMLHGNPGHTCSVGTPHALDDLPDCANALAEEYLRARHETGKAMLAASARSERGKARLEAILRDLSEGVVVCTLRHRVVLYNDAAASMLGGGGRLGLNRPLTALLDQRPLRGALARLYREDSGQEAGSAAEFACRAADGGRTLRSRMQLVREPSRGVTGYVLCLDGAPPASGAPVAETEERPFYYDFDLFEGAAEVAGRDCPLGQLDCVVFDSETTGLNPSQGDQLLQLAGVRVVNAKPRHEDVFDRMVDPGIPVPPASTRIHGITDAMVRGAPPPAEVVRAFHAWADGAPLVAHNAAFDMRFLELQAPHSGVRFEQPVLDTLLLSVLLTPEEDDHTLEALLRRLGVDADPAARHRALGDALTTAELYVRMLKPLAARGITTLGEALDASARLFEIRREQERF